MDRPVHDDPALRRAAELATGFLAGLPDRPVAPSADAASLRSAIDGPLPEHGMPSVEVVEALAAAADPGLVAMAGPRYFGFVIGGHHPAALAADWLTSTWDQNLGLYVAGPSLTIVEETAGRWLLDLLGLPASASFGFTTGAMMANFTAIAAARHALFQRAGWDVERHGLFGAPAIEVILGAEAHATVLLALQYLGLGRERVTIVPTDPQGRVDPDPMRRAIDAAAGPVLVCAQAGNVNTGAFDPFEPIADAVASHSNAWLHVDGAFGLWAAVSPRFAPLLAGAERADSWTTDAHKWLNVPYDCGFVACRDGDAHRGAMSIDAAYLIKDTGERDGEDWVPEFSRRARGVPVYAAVRAMGRDGIRAMIDRCCDVARRIAERLAEEPGVAILNDIVLDQALVRFSPPGAEAGDTEAADAFTRAVVAAIQADGTAWASGTRWHGLGAMRVSVVNWSTTLEDADRSADAMIRCLRRERDRWAATAAERPAGIAT